MPHRPTRLHHVVTTDVGLRSYMYDTYPPYLDQGLIQAVSTVSGPRYSRYSMYCISLYLDRGLIQLIQYVSDILKLYTTPYRVHVGLDLPSLHLVQIGVLGYYFTL